VVWRNPVSLKYTSTHCITLQHTATCCNTLQHTATHCNTLQHTAYQEVVWRQSLLFFLFHTHCNTLQHAATHCNTLPIKRWYDVNLSHAHTLQHTATHYNTQPIKRWYDVSEIRPARVLEYVEDQVFRVGLFCRSLLCVSSDERDAICVCARVC